MKKHRSLPIPFLVVILAAVLSVITSLADGGSRTGNAVENPLQVQTIEQERMATMYLRFMSWLSSIKNHSEDTAKADPPSVPAPKDAISHHAGVRRAALRMCSYRADQNFAPTARTRSTLN